VIFVDALPRNASGKLVRRSLDDALRVGASVI
jgi:acyl-coenzyme A synthetase/AMP-(fatty) acid ligase